MMRRGLSEWLIHIKGVVQGVGFRAAVQMYAEQHHVTGYVENRLDGSVEICAQGDELSLENFLQAVRARPGLGSIEGVQIDRRSLEKPFTSFKIRM